MPRTRELSRRTLLRGAGSVAISLPLLEAMGCGRPAARDELAESASAVSGFPKRFVPFFTPDGPVPTQSAWSPTGTETAFNFPAGGVLEPLAPHKAGLLVLDGLDYKSGLGAQIGGGPHKYGTAAFLTGTRCGSNDFAQGPSLDQVIATSIGATSRFKSLEFGVQVEPTGIAKNRMCYVGASQALPPTNDPSQMFTRVFGSFTPPSGGGTSTPDPLTLNRRSVLDKISADYRALSAKLGPADKLRVDQHLAAIRDIEMRLSNTTMMASSACAKPPAPGAPADYPTAGKLQMDLLVMALACDLTRVASIQWSQSLSDIRFSDAWVGVSGVSAKTHHDWTHSGYTAASIAMEVAINRWYAQQLAYLIAKLKAVPEGSGTLFDSCAILWGSECSRGSGHVMTGLGEVIAGGCGGALRTGRHLQLGGLPHNNLLAALGNAFGVTMSSFGDPSYCTGVLSGVLA